MKSFIVVGTVVAIVIACGISIYYYPQTYPEFSSVFVKDPLWASVVVTIVLVAINAYYAWQVRQTIREMEKARKAEFIPHVRAELIWLGPIFLLLQLTNFGKGPAINIKAQITFLPSKEKRLWDQMIMSPSESIRILLPEGNIDKVCETSAQILVKGEYKDIFGQTFEISDTIDTKEFIEQAKQLRPLLERDVPRLIENIKDELAKISKNLHDIEFNQRWRMKQEPAEESEEKPSA